MPIAPFAKVNVDKNKSAAEQVVQFISTLSDLIF